MTNEEKQPEQEKQSEQETPKADRASKMMNDMISGLREFGSVAMEKAEELGKLATEKAEELTKVGKIKLDIHQLNRSKIKTLAELGELVFNLGEEDKLTELSTHENYTVLAKSIREVTAKIKDKEAQAEDAVSEDGPAEVKE